MHFLLRYEMKYLLALERPETQWYSLRETEKSWHTRKNPRTILTIKYNHYPIYQIKIKLHNSEMGRVLYQIMPYCFPYNTVKPTFLNYHTAIYAIWRPRRGRGCRGIVTPLPGNRYAIAHLVPLLPQDCSFILAY